MSLGADGSRRKERDSGLWGDKLTSHCHNWSVNERTSYTGLEYMYVH